MSRGGDEGHQLENNQEEQEVSSSSTAAAAQNVFREVFDERSEPSDTGSGLKRHAVRGRSLNHQHTQSHILIVCALIIPQAQSHMCDYV